jgi:NAD(P)H dehydrogenase (quinone)
MANRGFGTPQLIVYHSFTGKTKSLAEAAADAARSAGAQVTLREASAASVEDVAASDVPVVATPQTFGSLAGETKKFFERLWLAKDKLGRHLGFASIICHSQEPPATRELFTALPGYFGFVSVQEPLLVSAGEVDAGREKARNLGIAVAHSS